MTKNREICSRCGCEHLDSCIDGCTQVGNANWVSCEQARRVEREVWLAKLSVPEHHILAWEGINQVAKNGSGKSHFVYARSAELGYTVMRSLPGGKIRAVPTSRLHPKKKSATTE